MTGGGSRFLKGCGGAVGALVCSRLRDCLAVLLVGFPLRVMVERRYCALALKAGVVGRLLRLALRFRLLLGWSSVLGLSRSGCVLRLVLVCGPLAAVEEVLSSAGRVLMQEAEIAARLDPVRSLLLPLVPDCFALLVEAGVVYSDRRPAILVSEIEGCLGEGYLLVASWDLKADVCLPRWTR